MTRTDSTRTAVVDDAHEWRRMSECPPHRKCLLRNAGGMPAIGTYDGRDPQWTGWVPLPVVPGWMRDDPHA
jgi:hypothetical protein